MQYQDCDDIDTVNIEICFDIDCVDTVIVWVVDIYKYASNIIHAPKLLISLLSG